MTETSAGRTAGTATETDQKFNIDTVENAAETPDAEQPWAELGLKQNEYDEIREILGRRPTGAELAMYSVMWSEHCSYKSSKVHLRQFGEKMTDEMKKDCSSASARTPASSTSATAGPSRSRSSPTTTRPSSSPTRARRPASAASSATSSPWAPARSPSWTRCASAPSTTRTPPASCPASSPASAATATAWACRTSAARSSSTPCYQGNPLVNALCVGVMRHEDIHLANASGVGNQVVLFGARTGGDGIGGVSVLASETFDDTEPTKRPTVQVGDPFTEKVLIECCLELFGPLVEGIQDLGAAGISCATSELASNGDGGMHVELDRVLLRDPTLTPERSS